MPPVEWESLLREQVEPRPGIHVTDLISCPRKKALARDFGREWIDADISRAEAALEGSILHQALAKVDPETAEVDVLGIIGGALIEGSIDRFRGDYVEDYKGNPSKEDSKRKPPDAPYPEQVWQVETYRYLLYLMLCTTLGWRIHYRWARKWLEPFEHTGPLWTEAEILGFRPNGSNWTVAEILAELVKVKNGARAEDIPMVGETMKLGATTACSWCPFEEACKRAGQPAVEF